MTNDMGEPGYRGDLNQQCVTIAEVLKMNGYKTSKNAAGQAMEMILKL